MDQAAIEQKVREELQKEFDERFAKEIEDARKGLEAANTKLIQETLEKYRKKLEPPDEKEIEKLLTQEYITFKVSIPGVAGAAPREFTLYELPMEVERKLFAKVKEQLVPKLEDLAGFMGDGALEGGDLLKKIKVGIETMDPTMGLLADACATCLDPYGKDSEINGAWVQKHMSSYRIWNVVIAQIQVNRLRDFFSQAFRDSTDLVTT